MGKPFQIMASAVYGFVEMRDAPGWVWYPPPDMPAEELADIIREVDPGYESREIVAAFERAGLEGRWSPGVGSGHAG